MEGLFALVLGIIFFTLSIRSSPSNSSSNFNEMAVSCKYDDNGNFVRGDVYDAYNSDAANIAAAWENAYDYRDSGQGFAYVEEKDWCEANCTSNTLDTGHDQLEAERVGRGIKYD